MGGWMLLMAHQGGGTGYVLGTVLHLAGYGAHDDRVRRTATGDGVWLSAGVLVDADLTGGTG